ncbi:yggW [Wigglesworthia glossinidia endosymbiont of Glossina brevipalpis]|uniref:YggW protein n=1 Tax=Wigglesworthia glossinidia brevipalpis TaxID=36870 RepID=Q8D3C4_WIGBR|nr:yggW [Wigglesworthia glossinidia endosymbiont of Glossina brevipalpis]
MKSINSRTSLYINIPWIFQKKFFKNMLPCEFEKLVSFYIKNTLNDLEIDKNFSKNKKINTLFIGGNVNVISENNIKTLFFGIKNKLNFKENMEFTIEINTKLDLEKKIFLYKKIGINRISIEKNIFCKKTSISKSINNYINEISKIVSICLRVNIKNINVDLPFFYEYQTNDEILHNIEKIFLLKVPHQTCYQHNCNFIFKNKKMVEKKTKIKKIYNEIQNLFKFFGFHQYEICSYALPGFECLHNLNYFQFGDYFGIGCGSHGKFTLKKK